MNGHIDELAAGFRRIGQCPFDDGPGILGIAAHQYDIADVAVLDFFLCHLVGMVKAAHESKHENLIRMRLDNGLRLFAFFDIFRQGLFAEHMLAGLHGYLDHLHVRSGIGKDGDSLHFAVRAHLRRILEYLLHAQLFRDFLRMLHIKIADRDQFHAGNAGRNILCVLISQTSDSDDTDLQFFHNAIPPNAAA